MSSRNVTCAVPSSLDADSSEQAVDLSDDEALAGVSQVLRREIADIRQGKFFEIVLTENTTEEEARESAEKIAKNVLANPVIENFHYEISEG